MLFEVLVIRVGSLINCVKLKSRHNSVSKLLPPRLNIVISIFRSPIMTVS